MEKHVLYKGATDSRLALFVNVFTMTYSDDGNELNLFIHFVNYTIVTNSDTPVVTNYTF